MNFYLFHLAHACGGYAIFFFLFRFLDIYFIGLSAGTTDDAINQIRLRRPMSRTEVCNLAKLLLEIVDYMIHLF